MSIKLVVIGTSHFGVPSFERLRLDLRFKIVGVVTQPAKPTGRHQIITPSPVAVWAASHNLPTITPNSLKTEDSIKELKNFSAELYVVASYGLILPAAALAIPRHGCLNIHASILPKYRGASPISAALLSGDQTTGITFMKMDIGCDTGPIIKQITVPIESGETRTSLEDRLSVAAAESINLTALDWINKKITSTAQSTNGVSAAPRLTRSDGLAIWDDAARLERQIRAYHPWPGLWTSWNGTEIKILSAVVLPESSTQPVGLITHYPTGWGIVCHHGVLQPIVVQFSGKKPQPAETIPGGYPGFIGSRLS